MNSNKIIHIAEQRYRDRKNKRITHSETLSLIKEYKENNCQKAFYNLMLAYINVFHRSIINYAKLDARLYDDLMQESVLLIEKAIRSYNADKGMKFHVYLKTYFGGELSRRFRSMHKTVSVRNSASSDLKNQSEYNKLRIASAINETQDIYDFLDDNIEIATPTQLIYSEEHYDSLSISKLKEIIIEICDTHLSSEEKFVVIENILKDRPQKALALELGRSYVYVSSVFKSGMNKITKELEARGLDASSF